MINIRILIIIEISPRNAEGWRGQVEEVRAGRGHAQLKLPIREENFIIA